MDEEGMEAETSAEIGGARLAELMREQILCGKLEPGMRIRQEELAAQYGASRQPVRDALRMLASTGLVRLVANTGAWVSSLTLNECVEIYRMRELLEPLALRDSVPNLDPLDIERMRELCDRMASDGIDASFIKNDRQFHLLGYAGSSMTMLRGMIESFWDQTQHYRRTFVSLVEPDRQWVIHSEHRLIMDAIERRDAIEAAALLKGHIRRTRIELQKHPELFKG
ncbi:GntR family transcriptional regulator [Sphingobium chlorophenolicum]|nr:GntR family transcriptional regulator [Sphingobium chlorophenolicum]